MSTPEDRFPALAAAAAANPTSSAARVLKTLKELERMLQRHNRESHQVIAIGQTISE